MLRAVVTMGLLAVASMPEARPLPPEVQAAKVLDGTALLVVDAAQPEGRLTLLKGGVYFADEGYQRLSIATQQLQANLRAVEAKVKDYEAAALVPCPEVESPRLSSGWDTRTVLLVGVVGVAAGVVGGVLLHGLVARGGP